jgi:hypothetical protein
VFVSCKHGNIVLGSINCGKFDDQLRKYQHVMGLLHGEFSLVLLLSIGTDTIWMVGM